MNPSNSSILAVCLDWAGTTIDFGCQAPVAVFRAAFEAEGVPVSDEEIRVPMGMGKRDHIGMMLELPGVRSRWFERHGSSPEPADVDRLYGHFLPLQGKTVARHVGLIPGVLEALAELRGRGIRIGATTGYPREVMEVVEPLAAKAGYRPEVSLAIDEVDHGRPAPDQLLAALAALGDVPPARGVAVDDTLTGVEAGRNAGMWTVGVAVSGNLIGLSADAWAALPPGEQAERFAAARSLLRQAGAHAVVPTVADLVSAVDDFEECLRRGEKP